MPLVTPFFILKKFQSQFTQFESTPTLRNISVLDVSKMRKRSLPIWTVVLLFVACRQVNCILNRGGPTSRVADNEIQKNQSADHFRIEMKPHSHVPGPSETLYFVVTNEGSEDDYVHMNISDNRGYITHNRTAEFSLPPGSKREIPVELDFPLINGTIVEHDMDIITVEASGRSSAVKRSIFLPGSDFEFGGRNAPFCYDRYVTGNCRYRTDPAYCSSYEWTAYAIIQNLGGFGSTLRSVPTGLYVPPTLPGSRERVRVWVKTSCCFPFVEIISSDHNVCIIDVRELQWLHPGEIAAIVIGILLLIIIIIVIAVLLLRKRRSQTIVVGHHTRSREHISPRDRE